STHISPLSLHDALPIFLGVSHSACAPFTTRLPAAGCDSVSRSASPTRLLLPVRSPEPAARRIRTAPRYWARCAHRPLQAHPRCRSEEHTSELQSLTNLV